MLIGVFKSGDKETLVVHLPNREISCLLTYFLKAAPESNLNAMAPGKISMLLLQRAKHLQIFY